MNKLAKKIVAILTTVTCAVFVMGPGSASALTSAELQAQIDALLAQISALQSQLTQTTGTGTVTGCSITSFTRNLTVGSSGDDVKCLQIILNSDAATTIAASGVGSAGSETTYFGALTKAAVIKFQNKYASEVLTPLGLTAGTGFVGAKSIAKLNTMIGTSGTTTPTTPTTPATGAATIMLASDSPAAAQTALAAQDAVFTKVKFYGGASGATITKIILTRSGVSADADVSAVKLYDGTTQLGSTQALNTNTHKATFTGLSWDIPAGATKYLTIKGSIAALGTATVGDSIKLGIASASEITATAALSGTFPIYGEAKTIAGISVGELFVATTTAPAAATLLSGSTAQQIAGWTFQASSTEGMSVTSIKVTHSGSATRDDVKNIKLELDGVQLGSTIATLDAQNSATFDLSATPLNILAGQTKTIYAYADIASGIWTSRTIIFEITQYTDIVAYGTNSGGAVQASYTDALAFSKAVGNIMTVGQGALTVSVDAAYNPASQSYVKGTSNRLMSAFKFSAGSTEGVRVTQLKLTFSGTVTNISNITLWDGTTQIGSAASAVGTYITFGSNTIGYDSTGLFDIAKSGNKTILVKADIPSGATTAASLEIYINAAADVYADGLDSKYDLTSSSITATSAGASNTNAHTVAANGSLTIAKSSLSAPAQTYVKGSTNGSGKEFLTINLTAGSGEDILVTSIIFNCYNADGATACAAGTTTNAKLLKADGTQYGSTVASPSSQASFSGNITVPASETISLKLVADIPSSAGTGDVIWKQLGSAYMTSTGVSSSADITETGTATANTISIGAGSLTLAAAATPGDQTLIRGAVEVPMVGLVMTAGTAEDARVTSITLTTSASGKVSPYDVGNISLWDGTTRLTAKKNLTTSTDLTANTGYDHHTVAFTASDFLNSIGIDVVKGQEKVITVKGDLLSTADGSVVFAIGVSSTDDFVATGLSSNSEIAETRTLCTSCTGVNYDYADGTDTNQITIQTAGTLTMQNNAGKPSVAIVAVGEEGAGLANVVFQKVDFLAAREDIYVKTFQVGRIGGSDADFASITLWDGTTQIGTAQSLVNASTTFSLASGSYWVLPKGVTKTLTIKANLNGVRTADGYGALTGDAPYLQLDLVTVQGVSSGSTSISTTADLAGNIQYIRQSKPTLASATLPSNVYGSGEKVLYRWTVTADAKGAIGWKKVVFDMSGNVTNSTSHTIGCGATNCLYNTTASSSVMMATGTSDISTVALIATSSMKIWDLTSNEQVTATSGEQTGWIVNNASGISKVSFVAASEQIVAAGETRTYEFRGTLNYAGATGDVLQTKIADRATTASTTVYGSTGLTNDNNTVGTHTNLYTFIWSDRSGYATTHSSVSSDWTHDYKVNGIPTATLSLSR